jgi:hypothetical protein
MHRAALNKANTHKIQNKPGSSRRSARMNFSPIFPFFKEWIKMKIMNNKVEIKMISTSKELAAMIMVGGA